MGPAHIFIDNSNVIGGARGLAEKKDPTTPWVCVRVDLSNFFELIEGGYIPSTRFFSGSLPPNNEPLWDFARKRGYETALAKRVEHNEKTKEQGVDELIHLRMADALLFHEPPQTMILVTGDGKEGQFGTSFTRYVKQALKRGWNVEIWSWKKQLSPNLKNTRLNQIREGQLSIFEFDSLYMRLVFISGNGVACYNGTNIPVRSRNARPLQQGDRELCRIR